MKIIISLIIFMGSTVAIAGPLKDIDFHNRQVRVCNHLGLEGEMLTWDRHDYFIIRGNGVLRDLVVKVTSAERFSDTDILINGYQGQVNFKIFITEHPNRSGLNILFQPDDKSFEIEDLSSSFCKEK